MKQETDYKPAVSGLKVILTMIYLLFFPLMLFLLAGDWQWSQGWIFSSWFMVLCITCILYLYLYNPALLVERYKTKSGDQAGWDRYVVMLIQVSFLIWWVIMPLDAKRFRWSVEFPVWAETTGCVMLLLSGIFFFRSYRDNSFLSPLVRIQTERLQSVVSTGVYGIVRHPMYFAAVLLFIGAPLLLGSLFAMIFGVIFTFLLVGRIIGEEKVMLENLKEYREYQQKVKFRLIPYIW